MSKSKEVLLVNFKQEALKAGQRPPLALAYCDREGKVHIVDYMATGDVVRQIVAERGDEIVARYTDHRQVVSFGIVGKGVATDPAKQRKLIQDEMDIKGITPETSRKIWEAYHAFRAQPLSSTTSEPQRPGQAETPVHRSEPKNG